MGNICGCGDNKSSNVNEFEKQYQKCLFGGGCFWCIEAAFMKNKGVISAVSGYAGGEVDNPTY